MSLLLEALKKAELAKQNSLGSAHQAEDSGGIRFEEPSEPFLATDPRQETAAPDTFTLMAPPEPVAAPSRPAQRAPVAEPDVVSPVTPNPQRAAARKMFEAKEVDYNPKRNFYLTLGALGLAAVGYGGYLWWQLQPRYTVNTAAVQSSAKAAPIASAPPPQLAPPPDSPASPGAAPAADSAQPAAAPASPPVANQPATLPAPAAPVAAPQAPAPQAKPAPVTAAASPTPASLLKPASPGTSSAVPGVPAPVAAAQRPAAPRSAVRLPIKVNPPSFKADEVLESAYTAYQRGELDRARADYLQVLGREANNRDALLGLAAIDVRRQDYDTAELRYLKLLELDPRDSHAHAALISLQGTIDPVQSESRLKNMLAAQPDATHLYFTLGNQYAAQSRWAEAQDAYFKAHSSDPDNADFAFNLAVSLDQLRQRKLALDFYRKALTLAGTRAVGFDRKVAEARAQELAR